MANTECKLKKYIKKKKTKATPAMIQFNHMKGWQKAVNEWNKDL